MVIENESGISNRQTATLSDFVFLSERGLPLVPSSADVLLLRKGLRKRAVPDLNALPEHFEYPNLGKFEKCTVKGNAAFRWQSFGLEERTASFYDMCRDQGLEMFRLEFGWMIASFAALDGARYLRQLLPVSYEDYHQIPYWKKRARQEKHFLSLVREWRHWAVVRAGHMKLSTPG